MDQHRPVRFRGTSFGGFQVRLPGNAVACCRGRGKSEPQNGCKNRMCRPHFCDPQRQTMNRWRNETACRSSSAAPAVRVVQKAANEARNTSLPSPNTLAVRPR